MLHIHFANTLAFTHTTLVRAYFGAKKINPTSDLLLTALPLYLRVDVGRVVHHFWSTDIRPLRLVLTPIRSSDTARSSTFRSRKLRDVL